MIGNLKIENAFVFSMDNLTERERDENNSFKE